MHILNKRGGKMEDKQNQNDVWVNRIFQALENLSYGSVQIIVQDGRIVQIERTEKERFSPKTNCNKQHNN